MIWEEVRRRGREVKGREGRAVFLTEGKEGKGGRRESGWGFVTLTSGAHRRCHIRDAPAGNEAFCISRVHRRRTMRSLVAWDLVAVKVQLRGTLLLPRVSGFCKAGKGGGA